MFDFVTVHSKASYDDISNLNPSKIEKSIEESIARYKDAIKDTDKYADEKNRRADLITKNKEDFKSEIITRLDELGLSYKQKFINEKGELENEISEDEKGGGINIKESFESNSKDNASARVKLMLSQIMDVDINPEFKKANVRLAKRLGVSSGELTKLKVNFKKGIKDGLSEEDIQDLSIAKLKPKPGQFLNRAQFVEFDEVWSTLEPALADIVTYSVGNNLVDAFDQMKSKITALEMVKPYLSILKTKMGKMSNDQKAEFVQAFSKVKLNFLVTEYDSDSKKYKIINATSTNSRDSKIRNEWGNKFKEIVLDRSGKLDKEGKEMVAELSGDLRASMVKFNEQVKINKGKDLLPIIADNIPDILKIVNKLGSDISINDFVAHIKLMGGDKNAYREMNDMYSGIKYFFEYVLNPSTVFYTDGEFNNPFDNQESIKALSRAKAMFERDIAENNILGNEGKSYFTYSLPSYIHNTVNQWKGDPSELDELATRIYNGNSLWLNHLLGTSKNDVDSIIIGNGESREAQKLENIAKIKVMLSSSFKSKGKNDGKDNKTISFVDAVNDSVSKSLGHRIVGGKNYAQTIIPADKSRKIELEGMPSFDSNIDFINGEWVIPNTTIDVHLGYYTDEYNRMKEASNELDSKDPSELVVHYHTGAKNAFKSQIYPELSPENLDKNSELYLSLYDANGMPLGKSDIGYSEFGISDKQKDLIREAMRESLISKLDETVNDMNYSGVIHISSENEAISISINEDVLKSYEGNSSKVKSLIGDYFMNSFINNVEYNKLFIGDPAYYKNMPDLIKRTPASYTDGLQLFLNKDDFKYFNQATITGVEITSKYIDLIRSSLKDKSIADAYGNGQVNSTDAQAWITPGRWEFLVRRLGKWTPLHDNILEKLNYVNPKTGVRGKRLSKAEMKVAAQPMKGVYFDLNMGRPVYLKYSQAVLIPQLVKGTPMQAILDKMTLDADGNKLDAKDEIHEVITIDGVKVGAVSPTKIHNEDGTVAKNFSLNPVKLKNRGWKLQQDLPTKLAHKTMTGSQIQKNILAGIIMDGKYDFNGESKSGAEILKEVHDTVSKLSNLGKDNIISKFDIKVDDITGEMKINNLDAVYSVLIDEFRSRGGSDNIINALEKEMSFDSIPQIKGKVENIFMSIMNKELTKIYTNGGAFIQVAPFGMEHVNEKDISGIKIISKNYDSKGLKPPHKDPKTGKMMPGQVFLPHSALLSLFDQLNIDHNALSGEELMKYLTPGALDAVGYRIPNQGMSSNDAFEIVGILPPGIGDSIIAYDAVPTKTGSDFDIDKMYLMLNNLEINKETGLIDKVKHDANSNNIDALQNRLIDLYSSILNSEAAYDKVMTSIDASFFKDDVVGLFPSTKLDNMKFYSPMYQIKTKFEYLSGKMGVAQTANQLVDHVLNRTQNIRLNEFIGIGYNQGGVTKFDNEYDIDGKHLIGDSISAFLNAYVDIAKDPYVSRGNHNAITAGTTFMLLRAGVPVEWVNRFVAQPILVELVELTKSSEGITSDDLMINGERVNPYQYLRAKYGIAEKKATGKNAKEIYELGKAKLEEIIVNKRTNEINEFSEDDIAIQENVLNTFEYFLGLSKDFSESVKASKTPDFGNFAQVLAAQNTYDSVVDKGKILGFQEKFTDSMTGTYKENGLEWVAKLASDNKLFLSANNTIQQTVNTISSRTGRGFYAKNEDFIKSVFDNFYSYTLSGFKPFKDNSENVTQLFTEVPNRLNSMKAISNNFLIKELEVKESKGVNFIKLNSKNKPKSYNNKIYRSWVQLLTSKNVTEKNLGVDLIKYAYSQSGFQNNINQFFTHIPHEFLLGNGIDDYIASTFNELNSIGIDIQFRDQMFRHSYEDRNLVPAISNKNVSKISADFNIKNGFIYNKDTEKGNNSISTGKNEDGFDTYPEFVTMKTYITSQNGSSKAESNLYKLVGGYYIKNPEGKGVFSPVYTKTFKLGVSSNSGKIYEYAYGKDITQSSIGNNNVSKEDLEVISKMTNFAEKQEGFIYPDILLDPTENLSSEEEVDWTEEENTSEDPFECK